MSELKHIILWLDLAKENQHTEAWIREQCPELADARLFRLTDCDAASEPSLQAKTARSVVPIERQGIGTPDNWLPVLAGIERMLARARQEERDVTCHYWVVGRAGLPGFVYLGYRLSRKALVTLINKRDDGSGIVDILPLDGHGASPASSKSTFFDRSPGRWPLVRRESRLPVGLLVSSLHKEIPIEIEGQLARRGEHLANVVGALSSAKLGDDNVFSVIRELDEIVRDVHHAYNKREALDVFVAGPATLAFLVGRALTQSIFPNVRVYQYLKIQQEYELAYRIGYRRARHPILFLTANPPDHQRLDIDEELRAVDQALKASTYRSRFKLEPRAAPRPGELFDLLREVKPTILHFSGHGSTRGVYFRADATGSCVMSADDLVDTLEAVRASVTVIVLNACHSTALAETLRAHADCVVATTREIPDADARVFAAAFYAALGARESVHTAFHQGLAQLRQSSAGSDPRARDREVCRDPEPADSPVSSEHPPELLKLSVRDGVDARQIVLAEGWE
ncbi:MAG TPA: CHAT domain-containing protein [Kofleriaceae bacterium]|nr:CHAT domain-containing protein [Kofleriaceae bacterium]